MIPLIYIAAVGAALLLTDGHRIVQQKQRKKQLVIINKTETIVAKDQRKKYQWNLLLCGSALTSLLVAPAFYPLQMFAITLLSRMMIDVAYTGIASISEQRRPTLDFLDTVIGAACIWSGQWLVLSVSGIVIFARHALIAKTEADSLRALSAHFTPSIDTVRLQTINDYVYTPIEKIKSGDRILVKTGEIVPIDGVISTGTCMVSEYCKGSECTVEKTINHTLLANSTIIEGEVVMVAAKSGNTVITTELSSILATTKESTVALEAKGEEIANFFAPVNFTLGLVTLPFIGAYRSAALWNAVPTAYFRMIVPVAVLQQITTLTEMGMIVKDGRSLTRLSKVTTIVIDKIGTLTEERMIVTEIMPQAKESKSELLSYAASLEANQAHPIAHAIIAHANKQSAVTSLDFTDIKLHIGQGVSGDLNGDQYRIGNFLFLKQAGVIIKKQPMRYINYIQNQGASCVCIARNRELLGIFTVMPKIREAAFPTINALKKAKFNLILVSGDHQQSTKATADIVGIKKYVGDCSSTQKAQLIATLQAQGETVFFIGDGINDIEAMQQAEISMSVSGAMRVVQDNADIIYMPADFPPLIQLIDQAKQHIQNLQNAMHTTIIPSPIIIVGATFFGMGLLSSLLINQLSVLIAMRKLKHSTLKEANALTTEKRV